MCFVEHLGVNRKLDNRNIILLKFRLFTHAWGLRGDMQFFSSRFSWFIRILSLLSRFTTKNASHKKWQISYSQLGSNNNKHAYVVVVEHIEREFWYSGLILVIKCFVVFSYIHSYSNITKYHPEMLRNGITAQEKIHYEDLRVFVF